MTKIRRALHEAVDNLAQTSVPCVSMRWAGGQTVAGACGDRPGLGKRRR